jgi:hypothetical protein
MGRAGLMTGSFKRHFSYNQLIIFNLQASSFKTALKHSFIISYRCLFRFTTKVYHY